MTQQNTVNPCLSGICLYLYTHTNKFKQLFAEYRYSEYGQSCSSHDPETMELSHPNAEVIFSVHNTTSVLQPMDQQINKTFT
jgi:hypothetical protein